MGEKFFQGTDILVRFFCVKTRKTYYNNKHYSHQNESGINNEYINNNLLGNAVKESLIIIHKAVLIENS